MGSLTHALIMAMLVVTFVACEATRVASPHHVTGSTIEGAMDNCGNKDDSESCRLARANLTELAWYKDNEWSYNRGRDDAERDRLPPRVCVAISGGGIRSAAFGIGVMKGLNNKVVTHTDKSKSLLKYVDILSGTSGGAYAVSWYYMQYPENDNPEVNPDTSDKQLFESQGPIQGYLQDNADFLGMPAYVSSVFGNVVLASPFNFVINGLWGAHQNMSLAYLIYKSNIKNTFHHGYSATLVDLREKIKMNNLPFFIITATSRIDENNFHAESLLRNTVFEFTPLRMGNDGYTYIRSDNDRAPLTDLADIVTISGAAPDSSQLIAGNAQRFLSSGLNADYGQYIRNYNDTRHQLRRTLTKLLPIPLYLFTESYNRDLRGSDIYLSDGGHQENLAAYPLIRRQCEHLIIVDGEYDHNYEFESYFKLKHSIERELQVTMNLMPTKFCKDSQRVDCRETDIERIEYELHKNTELPGTRGEAEDRRQGIPRCCFSGQHPVVDGTISYFPILDTQTNTVLWKKIKVTYIKLSIDEELFKGWEAMSETQRNEVKVKVGTDAATYFASVITDTCKVRYFYPCAFPQFSTAYQSFTATQFKAYVDLGATIVERHLKAVFYNGSLKLTTCDASLIEGKC